MRTNSRWSGPPVREVVWGAVQCFTGGDVDVEFAIKDIKQVALEMYPNFKVSNVGPEITAGCVNSASRHHYSPDIDRYWKVKSGVYRLYESDQPVNLDDVLEKIKEITKESAGDDYIYRGESKCHEKVSSSLYRVTPHMEEIRIDMNDLQDAILKEAIAYIDQTDDIDDTEEKKDNQLLLLTDIQHFGGKTNLIDFTEDYLIALFFACDGSHEEDGQVILLKRASDNYEIRKPRRRTNPRVESQKSIFVESPTGFVQPDVVVTIPVDLKNSMLDYLEKYHRISIATIYNDLHGFIRRSAHTELLKALTYEHKASKAKTNEKKHKFLKNAIKHYTEALKLKFDSNAWAYEKRGIACYKTRDFHAAIEDFNKVIDLAPEDAGAYNNRGDAWLHLKEWQKAKADLTTAKDMGWNIVASFQNDYESVEDFEAKNGVTLPKDIAALLSGNKMNDTGQKRNEQYWAAFFEALPSDKLGLKIPNIYDSHYRDLHMGITGCYIRVSQRVRPSGIAAAFVMKGSAQDFFHSLIEQQTEIENELGEKFY